MTLLATDELKSKTMTIEEFMALPDDGSGYELIEGVLTERKEMGALSDAVAATVIMRLGVFAGSNGYVFTSDTIYRCFGNPHTGRKADVSYIARERLPEGIPEGFLTVPADLAIEIVSPSDLAYEVQEKVELYLEHGFGEVWVIYPNVRTLFAHRKGEKPRGFAADDVVQGSGPLEGFAARVIDFFPFY
jgi:Uma2 family endonuclease